MSTSDYRKGWDDRGKGPKSTLESFFDFCKIAIPIAFILWIVSLIGGGSSTKTSKYIPPTPSASADNSNWGWGSVFYGEFGVQVRPLGRYKSANIRLRPTEHSKLIGKASAGLYLRVLNTKDIWPDASYNSARRWWRVYHSNGRAGYVLYSAVGKLTAPVE